MVGNRSSIRMSRRAVVDSVAGLAALGLPSRFATAVQDDLQSGPGLREMARTRGVFFGASAVSNVLRSDRAMAAIYRREATMIVADYEMKWGFVRPAPAAYSYDGADYLVNFAAENGLSMRGHCLEVTSAAGLRPRQHFLNLLDRLKSDRVPVDAVGLECHLSTRSPFNRDDFAQYLSVTSDRGFKILITEPDVSMLTCAESRVGKPWLTHFRRNDFASDH
jgi:GH35 family endo-1,4-beta-xylanase